MSVCYNWTELKTTEKKTNQTNNAHENRQVETRHKDLCSIKESINLQMKQDNETNAKLTNEHDLEQKHFEMALSIDIGIPHAATRYNFFFFFSFGWIRQLTNIYSA